MASKKSFDKVVLEESDEDSESMLTASKKKTKRRCLEDSDCEMAPDKEGIVNKRSPESPAVLTSTPRSSERLREKLQRRHTLPSRKEVLNKICDGDKLCEKRSLKPRNLTNDLVRGSSRYVTDKTNIFESTGSDVSDFIDDTEDIRPEKKKRKKKRMKGNDEKRDLSSDSDDNTGIKKSAQKRRKKYNKVEKCSLNGGTVSSGDSDVQLNNKLNKQHRCLNISDDDDEKPNEIQEDGESTETCQIRKSFALRKQTKRVPLESDSDNSDTLESNRNLRRRPKSLRKEKEEKLLAKISAKRKFEKSKSTQPNNDAGIEEVVVQKEMEDIFGDYLIQRKHIILSGSEIEGEELNIEEFSGDELEEDELDREFVVDDFCDDSDGVTEFYKHLHNSEDADVTSNNLLESRKKKLNHFKRISVVHESEESDDDISSSFSSDMVAIYNAVQENDLNTAKAVLENNPNVVHEVGAKRQTLLHHAVICGSSQIMKLLIDFGSDELALDVLSLPPVGYAVLYGYTQCLEILLQDTDLNYLNKILEKHFNFSLLHFVVYGRIALPDVKCQAVDNNICLSHCLQILFEQDDPLCLNLMKSYDSHGHTPLAAAVLAGQHQCVQYLLAKGAAVDDFETKNGGSLLHFAIECSVNSSIEAEQNKSDCLKVLLSTSLKTHINAVDYSGFTPLMYAAESGDYDCVLALLECGASVHCKDRHGTTSLHLAAASGDTGCIQLLLDYGHQVDCLDSCGWPPLLYANFAAQESCVLSLMKPNPQQIFVLGDLLRKGNTEAARQRNFKVVKDVLVALANQDAYYRVFNDFIRCNPEFLEEHDKGLLHQTWIAILDFDNKQKWFKKKLENARNGRIQLLSVTVSRDAVFEDAMCQLRFCSGSTLRNCNLAAKFMNEAGVCTGPKREFFVNICKDIVEARHKLFHVTDDNQYSFFPNAFLAEQAKIDGVMDEQDSCKSKQENNSKCLKTSSDNIHEVAEQNGADVQDTVTEDYMDEDGDAVIAELDLPDLCNTQSSDAAKLTNSESSAEKYLRCSKFIDKKLEKNLSQLRFLGKIIGTSICQGFFLNLHLSKPLVKQMLGIKLNHPNDLSYLDYQLHKNLVSFVLESDDVDDLMLPCDLDVINPWNNRLTTVKLFPQDRKEEWLTDKNKAEYVELVSQYKLTTLIKREIDSICEGLYEVIPKELFSLFTTDEFSLLINGVGKIDVEDWKKNTVYSNVGKRDDIIKWFWQIVSELKEDEKALLLKFSTGSPCLPAGGFAELQSLGGVNNFQIAITTEHNKIPTASTCFNRLKLTTYDNAKQLKDKLLIAIRHGTEGFSFS